MGWKIECDSRMEWKGKRSGIINKIIEESYKNRNCHYTAEGTRPSDVARVIFSSCFGWW